MIGIKHTIYNPKASPMYSQFNTLTELQITPYVEPIVIKQINNNVEINLKASVQITKQSEQTNINHVAKIGLKTAYQMSKYNEEVFKYINNTSKINFVAKSILAKLSNREIKTKIEFKINYSMNPLADIRKVTGIEQKIIGSQITTTVNPVVKVSTKAKK